MTVALPGVVFTMRYPDSTGYVWNTIAQLRDMASGCLAGKARCFMAFPRVTGSPSFPLSHAKPVELNMYDNSPAGGERIAEFVKANGIKVVVFMSALPSTVNMAVLRRLGVRTLNTENDGFDHIPPDSLLKQAIKAVTRGVFKRHVHDLHLANSRAQYNFQRSHAKIPLSRLALMENSVDCERYCPGERAAALAATGLAPNRRWIISVSQARPGKRLEILVRLAGQVIHQRPDLDVGFVYVGDGPSVEPARELADSLGLGDRFHFAGGQNNLVPYYRSADLLVHAAAVESFGLAIVEAMACGVPVVACAAGGPSETIVSGRTGALVPIDDADVLRETVLAYLDNETMRAQHGQAAREHAVARYSMARQSRELAGHIQRFL